MGATGRDGIENSTNNTNNCWILCIDSAYTHMLTLLFGSVPVLNFIGSDFFSLVTSRKPTTKHFRQQWCTQFENVVFFDCCSWHTRNSLETNFRRHFLWASTVRDDRWWYYMAFSFHCHDNVQQRWWLYMCHAMQNRSFYYMQTWTSLLPCAAWYFVNRFERFSFGLV